DADNEDLSLFALAGGIEVCNAIDIHFGGRVEELVHQDRRLRDRRGLDGVSHVVIELLLVVNDLHRPSPEDEAGANEDGVTDLLRDAMGIFRIARDTVGRLLQTELLKQLSELLAVAGAIDRIDRGADDGDT